MTKQFICREDYPIVSTKHGKLHGWQEDDVIKFYGIKYADAKRWQMPEEVADWEGVKECFGYGYVCPMLRQDVPGSGEMKVPHRYWPSDENCQYLNIWTSSIEPGVKKPVMVWIHGGAYMYGSSIEQQAYDGTNLCHYGDVVVVSLNHRLNILGYMDLSSFGEEYWNSANVGNADMVAALQWIHDNIAGFGGDPENVTIFGQSGGGIKCSALMQTESANGLFHKAILMSGVRDSEADCTKDSGKEIGEALMKELGVSSVQELAEVRYDRLAEAYNKVSPEVAKAGHYIGGNGPMSNSWYHGNPLLKGWTEHALQIPMMIGSTLSEFKGFAPTRKDRNTMSEADVRAMVEVEYGELTDHVIELYKKCYPNKNMCELMTVDTSFRPKGIRHINTKVGKDNAPVYSYEFLFEFPLYNGNGPWHCSDIPFVFHNTELVPVCNVPGVTEKLEHRMFSAFTNFAKYGDPNDPSLPHWPACEEGNEYTMLFDTECEVRDHNFDYELVELAVNHAFANTAKVEH